MQRFISRSLIQLIALARIGGFVQVRARHVSNPAWFSVCGGILAITLLIASTSIALSDVVSPSDRATSGVFVRERPSANSANIGTIQPGQQAELVGSVPYWYQVKLPDGRVGYVSKSWTQVQPTAAAAAAPPAGSATSAEFSIHVVDVGTGLAIALKGPDFFVIYDGGSNDDTARGDSNRFLAYLHKVFPDLQVINHLILSHPHRDHVELLPDVVAAYQVDNVWDSGAVNDVCGYRAFITAVSQNSGVTYRSARNDEGTHGVPFSAKTCYGQALEATTIQLAHGPRISNQTITLGQGATMTFLHADGSDFGSQFNRNSLVVQLELGGKRILFMGDAEAGGRAAPTTAPKSDSIEGMLLACCTSQLKSDIMIVGHHGSMTSSRKAFLDAVQAGTFVVSSGPTRYGSVVLPDQVVINELTGRGHLFRTDLNDDTCPTQAAKIGPDNDGRAGGCDNVRMSITSGSSEIRADYWRAAD